MKTILSRLRTATRHFALEDRASLSIEAAIILPVIAALYVAGYQYFDGYRRESQMFKASYAVADMLSRRLSLLSPQDLDGLESVYETLTFSEDASYMRFTEVRRTDDGLEVVWSYATDGQPALTTTRLQSFLDKIPRLDKNERLTLVEAYTYDSPFFSVGLEDRIIPNFVPISQRYSARLAFAPGENQEDNTSVNNNNLDCGTEVVLIDGVPLIGLGNCTAG